MTIIMQQVGDTSRTPYRVFGVAVTSAQHLLTEAEKDALDLRTFASVDAKLATSRTRLVRGNELAARLRKLGV